MASSAPSSGGGRTREQLLKLLESSARKLKQFDRKYGDAKAEVEALQGRLSASEGENAALQQQLRDAGEEFNGKLAALEAAVESARQAKEVETPPSAESSEELEALRVRCAKLADSEAQATEELERRLAHMQEQEKRYSYLKSQLETAREQLGTVQAEAEQESERADTAEESLARVMVEREQSAPTQSAAAEASDEATSARDDGAALKEATEAADRHAAENAKLRSALDEMKRKFLQTAKKKQGEFNCKVQGLNDTIVSLEERLRVAEAAVNGGSKPSPSDEETMEVMRTKLEEKGRKFQEQQKAVEDLREALGRATAAASDADSRLASHKASSEQALSSLRAEITTLRDAEAAHVEALAEAKAQVPDPAVKKERDAQQDKYKAAIVELKRKLERLDRARQRGEQEAASLRQQLQTEQARAEDERRDRDEVAASSHMEVSSLQAELKKYKTRAHILLQQKDEQLKNTVSTEEAAKFKSKIATLESECEMLLAARQEAEQSMAQLEQRLSDEKAALQAHCSAEVREKEQEAMGKAREWQERAAELKGRLEASEADARGARDRLEASERDANARIAESERALRAEVAALKEEAAGLGTAVDASKAREADQAKVLEELLREKEVWEQERAQRMNGGGGGGGGGMGGASPPPPVLTSAAGEGREGGEGSAPARFSLEKDILGDVGGGISASSLEGMTAQTPTSLAASRNGVMGEYIAELEAEVEEMRAEIDKRETLESVLKEELRKKDRDERRGELKQSDKDMEYLKNVVLKCLEAPPGQHEHILPALATLLQLAPGEVDRVREAFTARENALGAGGELLTQAATQGGEILGGIVSSGWGYLGWGGGGGKGAASGGGSAAS